MASYLAVLRSGLQPKERGAARARQGDLWIDREGVGKVIRHFPHVATHSVRGEGGSNLACLQRQRIGDPSLAAACEIALAVCGVVGGCGRRYDHGVLGVAVQLATDGEFAKDLSILRACLAGERGRVDVADGVHDLPRLCEKLLSKGVVARLGIDRESDRLV